MEVAAKEQDAESALKILANLPPDVESQLYELWSKKRSPTAAANRSAIIPPTIVTPTNAVGGNEVVDIGQHGDVVVDITDISDDIVFKEMYHEKMVVVKVVKSTAGAATTPEEVVAGFLKNGIKCKKIYHQGGNGTYVKGRSVSFFLWSLILLLSFSLVF